MTDRDGPFDAAEWPERLRARIVTPGPRPRVRGYDVEGDLARNYSFAEGVLIALTGEPPSAEQGRAFDVAMQFLSPAPVNEAPTHAAALARICAGSDAAIIGTAAVGLAEQARWTVAQSAAMLAWLDADGGPPPTGSMASDEEERRSVGRLREALLPTGLAVRALDHDLGRTPALLAVLHACGLRRAHAIESAWVIARLATAVAEAMTNKRRAFQLYPTQLPRFRYEEDPR
jgi:hypothetical protein